VFLELIVKRNQRYEPWLAIADELKSLHVFAYSEDGRFSQFSDSPVEPTGDVVGNWIREKCANGYSYWWDKTTLAGKATQCLNSFLRVIGDANGLYEETVVGRRLIADIRRIKAEIERLSCC
jgi:hypothetical protein